LKNQEVTRLFILFEALKYFEELIKIETYFFIVHINMCRTTEKPLLFEQSRNRKALRKLESKLLVFLPSFLLKPSHEEMITFVLECIPFISQTKQWNHLIAKLVNFALPPVCKPACNEHPADQPCKPGAKLSPALKTQDKQGCQPNIHRSSSAAQSSFCRVLDKKEKPPDTLLGNDKKESTFEEIKEVECFTLTNENFIPVDKQLSIQKTEKRKKSLKPWLLSAQRKQVWNESTYNSGFHPMKYTGNKGEILPTCLQHPSTYVTDRIKCKICTRELNLYVEMLKDAKDNFTEQQKIKEDQSGFYGVQVNRTMIEQQIYYHKRLEEYINMYGKISPTDQHIVEDHQRICEALFIQVKKTNIPFLSKKIQEGSFAGKRASNLYEWLLADPTGTGRVSLMIQLDRICKSNFKEAAANGKGDEVHL